MKPSLPQLILAAVLLTSGAARAQDASTIEWLERVAGLCEQKGEAPTSAAEIQAQIDKARADLQKEKDKWQEAKQSPPPKDNAAGSLTPGWASYLNDLKRKIDDLERRLKAAEKRLRDCGAVKPAAGMPAKAATKPVNPAPAQPPAGSNVLSFDPRTHELKDGKVVPKSPGR